MGIKDKAKDYKTLSKRGKRNTKITAGILLVFFVLVFVRGCSSSSPERDVSGESDLRGAGAEVRDANVDRTRSMETITDPEYREALTAEEDQQRQRAREQGEGSYIAGVETFAWDTESDERNPDEIADDFFGDDYLAEQQAQAEREQEQERQRQAQEEYEQLPASERFQRITPIPNSMNEPEPANSEPATNTQVESDATDDEPRYRYLSVAARQNLMDKKRSAISDLINTMNEAPSGAIQEHSAYEERIERQQQRRAERESATGRTGSRVVSRTVPGVVPGDRFPGFTRIGIDTDVTTWVDIEIGSGPLKGAIVSMVPERIEGYVVFTSDRITFGRKTAPFRAMALNPDDALSPAFSSKTNYRRMARWGGAAFAAVTETVRDLIGSQSRTSVTQNQMTQEIEFSRRDLAIAGAAAGLSEVARDISDSARAREPQVIVDRGHRMILVVMEPQEIPWLPEPYVIERTEQESGNANSQGGAFNE